MLYVGIDVSADNFHVAIYYPDSELFKLFSFPQSRNGFDEFKSVLLNLDDEVYIALEAAGSYSHNLFSFLKNHNFNVILLHPYAVKNILKAFSKSKTDSIDAKNIAFSLYLLGGNLKSSCTLPYDILSLRKLVRFRASLTASLSNLQKQLKNALRYNMPEILKFFKTLSSRVLISLLSNYPSRKQILSHEKEVIKLLSSFKKWSEEKAKSLIYELKHSIATTDPYDSEALIISSIVTQMKEIKEHIEKIDEQINKILSDIPQNPISTIPGVGKITQATIISEVGDINRFNTKQEFVSYVGLDPVIKQSGKSYYKCGISKKGNKMLRCIFYNLAFRVLRLIPKYRRKYNELVKRGKHPKVALIAIARKLAELVFILWKRNIPFDSCMAV